MRELQPAVRHPVPRLRGHDDDGRGRGIDAERLAVRDLFGDPVVVEVDPPERRDQKRQDDDDDPGAVGELRDRDDERP